MSLLQPVVASQQLEYGRELPCEQHFQKPAAPEDAGRRDVGSHIA